MRNTVHLVFLWHMHQPPYAVEDDAPRLPWVRLHALRAYYDMAWMLERHPSIHCVVNLSPCLIEQLRDFVEHGVRDAWYQLSAKEAAKLDAEERLFLVKHFFSINWKCVVDKLPRYAALLALRGKGPNRDVDADVVSTFREQDLLDLQVLFNLAWFGFAAREDFPELDRLREQATPYTEQDKARVLQLQVELASRVLPAYLRLHQREQIELSTSPANHPILPLLIDTQVAAREGRDLPRRFAWPQDARSQLDQGRATMAALTGAEPLGMWPSEGAVSDAALEQMTAAGVHWCATDEQNLLRVVDCVDRSFAIYHPWQFESAAGRIAVLFRDTLISDLIGFQYRRMPPHKAARDLARRVIRAGREARERGVAVPLVCLALDGENPWEHYHDDGRAFLEQLYTLLARMDRAPQKPTSGRRSPRRASIRTVRPCDFLQRSLERSELRHINPGSWIEGDYAIWIGHRAKNRAWELLAEARERIAAVAHTAAPAAWQRALRCLHRAEASDWFWWYGPNYSTGEDMIFDGLFRDHLRRALEAVGLQPSDALGQPVEERQSRGQSERYREPSAPLCIRFDGNAAADEAWRYAGEYLPPKSLSTMVPQALLLRRALFGRDAERLYVRLDLDESLLGRAFDSSFELWCGDRRLRAHRYAGTPTSASNPRAHTGNEPASHAVSPGCAQGCQPFRSLITLDGSELAHLRLDSQTSSRSLVVALPLEPLGAHLGLELGVFVRIVSEGLELMRIPRKGVLELPAHPGELSPAPSQDGADAGCAVLVEGR